jgi:hypothetical protein
MSVNRKPIALFALLALLAVIPNAQAVVLGPSGGPVAPDDFTGLPITGVAPGAFMLISPAVTPTFSGTVLSDVFIDGITGGLDFYYQYTGTATTPDAVERVTAASFSSADGVFADPFGVGVGVDIGTRNDTAGIPILLASGFLPGTTNSSTVTRGSGGSVVGFNFSPGITVPGNSFVLIVRTHAPSFGIGNGAVIDSNSANVAVWSPTPEPAFTGLMLGGLFAVGLFLTRRFRVSQN